MFRVIIPVVDEVLPPVLSQETELWRHKNGKFFVQINERAFKKDCTTQVSKSLFYSPVR
jgi:hypothetical protein